VRTLDPGTTPLGRPTFGGQLVLVLVEEQVHRQQALDRESRGKLRRVARDRWRNQKTRAARISHQDNRWGTRHVRTHLEWHRVS